MAHKPVRVEDLRTVDIDLSGPSLDRRPVLTTPAGKMPIACSRVELGYDLKTSRLRWCTVWGDLTDERDIARRRSTWRTGRHDAYEPPLVRRLSIDHWGTQQPEHAPEWLLELIERHRPVQPVPASMEHILGSYLDLEQVPGWQHMVADLLAAADIEQYRGNGS